MILIKTVQTFEDAFEVLEHLDYVGHIAIVSFSIQDWPLYSEIINLFGEYSALKGQSAKVAQDIFVFAGEEVRVVRL